MLLPSAPELTLLLAALSVATLTASYSVSSLQGRLDVMVSRGRLETVGLILGGIYLMYVLVELATAVALR